MFDRRTQQTGEPAGVDAVHAVRADEDTGWPSVIDLDLHDFPLRSTPTVTRP